MGLLDILFARDNAEPAAMVGFPQGGGSQMVPWGVTSSTVAGLPAVWRCLDVLAIGVSSLPWMEHRGTLELPLSRLTRRPVDIYTRREWTQIVVRTMALFDTCYLLKLEPYDSEGIPNGLWPVPPNMIVPRTLDNGLTPPREYQIGRTTVSADQLIPVRRGGVPGVPDWASGLLTLGRAEFAAYLSAQNYASRYWQAGGAPTTVLETDANLSDGQATQLGNRWAQRRSQGPDHPAILANGLKAREFGADPTTQSAVEARRDQVADIARYFGIPPRLVNAPSLDSQTYKTAQEENMDLLHYTLQNYIQAIEDAITDLLPGSRELSMIPSKLTEGTQLSRYQAYQLALGSAPWMTVADVREAEGMPPIEETYEPDETQRPLIPADSGAVENVITKATGRPNQ